MDESEARILLNEELSLYRVLPYSELRALVDRNSTVERTGPSGTKYQSKCKFSLTILNETHYVSPGAIDDGKLWRAIVPMCGNFIIAADGSFVGE